MRAPNTQRQMTPESVVLSRAAAHFESHGHHVREELPVYIPYLGKVITIDMVLTRDDSITAVQGKVDLNVKVIAQAETLKPFAHFVIVVCRHPGTSFITKEQRMLLDLCRVKGIGVWFLTNADEMKRQVQPPRNDRASIGPISEALSRGLSLPAPSEGGPTAGEPSPLGAKAHFEHDRWEKVRNYLSDCPTEDGLRPNAKVIADACDFTPKDKKDFNRMAPKGEIRGVKCHKRDAPYTYSLAPGTEGRD